jgi:hypothetical protein
VPPSPPSQEHILPFLYLRPALALSQCCRALRTTLSEALTDLGTINAGETSEGPVGHPLRG